MILDVSRLLACAWRGQPSGMDRVELAYARHALARPDTVFVGQSVLGRFACLPRSLVARILAGLEHGRPRTLVLAAWVWLGLGLGAGALRRAASRPGAVFHIVSHRALDDVAAIRRVTRHGARFVPAVIDLIPLLYPEYTRPAQTPRHAARMLGVAATAAGIIFSADSVRDEMQAWLEEHSAGMPPALVAPLGLDLAARAEASSFAEPHYFLCVATIEPRKNHMLLLQLWREIREKLGAAAPRLVMVGRSGWENEAMLRFLERHPDLAEWRGHCSDAELARLLAGARALLFPTFAEGFGIPLAEALAAGVPVLAADLPVLRELGGDAPDYLHPLDGPGWRDAVLDYASPDSPRRAAQLARIAAWHAPDWAAHFTLVERFIEGLADTPR
ncbi:MAG: glycosyltransferase family 1 protein [Alphaproteobacteria bacterium]|nr:glycosyltransferase family 1 protein [Alphaproteobacteria bacterium]